jgi:hypothetical protein
MVATRKTGFRALLKVLKDAQVPRLAATYDAALEAALERITALFPAAGATLGPGHRGIPIMLAAGDETMRTWVRSHLDRPAITELNAIIDGLDRGQLDGVAYAVNRRRLAAVDRIVDEVYRVSAKRSRRSRAGSAPGRCIPCGAS